MVGNQLILASASPRRLELLAQIGIIPNVVLPADIDETINSRETPRLAAKRLASEKARFVHANIQACEKNFILAADTVVALGRRVLDKPKDEQEAQAHLEQLSGRRHRIYGAIAVLCPQGRLFERVVTTIVRFKRLTKQEIENYLVCEEWRGKAGGYAIQGSAAKFIPWINGSYANVVGLSLSDTASLLESAGYISGNCS